MLSLHGFMSAEIKHCGKMPVVTYKFCQFIIFHIKYFSNGKRIIFFESIMFHILQIGSHSLDFFYHFDTGDKTIRSVRLK